MTITVNNQPKEFAQGTVVQNILSSLEITPNGIAIAINNAIIPKSKWIVTTLKNDDIVTIIQATQGG